MIITVRSYYLMIMTNNLKCVIFIYNEIFYPKCIIHNDRALMMKESSLCHLGFLRGCRFIS